MPPAVSFAELKLRQDLLEAMQAHSMFTPTEIQAKGIRAILSGQNVVLASHTGSGKTLAYLLPVIHQLKSEEEAGHPPAKSRRPRAVVLGPTRELTDQILAVTKSIAHHSKIRSTSLNAAQKLKTQKDLLKLPQDIVVSTPSRLVEQCKEGNIFFGDIHFLILDEADTMFDEGFGPEVLKIIHILNSKGTPCQFILVAATMTKGVRRLVDDVIPDMQMITTSSLHKGVAGARHNFRTLPQGHNKLNLLLEVLSGSVRKQEKTMVFCNTLNSCRAVEHALSEEGVATLCYHGEVPANKRKQVIEEFGKTAPKAADDGEYGDQGAASPNVLVCTDLAARGLDIPGQVEHIINFDFPLTSIDYLHRSGRTARAGRTGTVTSLLSTRDRNLAQQIERALQKNLSLDTVAVTRSGQPPASRAPTERKQVARTAKSRKSMRGVRGAARVEVMRKRSRIATLRRKASSTKKRRK